MLDLAGIILNDLENVLELTDEYRGVGSVYVVILVTDVQDLNQLTVRIGFLMDHESGQAHNFAGMVAQLVDVCALDEVVLFLGCEGLRVAFHDVSLSAL